MTMDADITSASSSSTYDIPKKVLEEEGNLRRNANVRLLEVQPWFHGMVTRLRAESLVRTPGDFLVRDSISSPGNYVITCFWQGHAVHFQINRLILPADESIYGSSKKILYQFEEEQFTSVVDLIEFYQAHQKVITEQSRCVIKNPVTRIEPVEANKTPGQADLRKEIEAHYADVNRRAPSFPVKGLPTNTPKNPNLTKRPLPQVPLGHRVILNEAKKQLHKYSSETGLNRIPDAADRSVSTRKSSADLTLPRKPTRTTSPSLHNQPSTAPIRTSNVQPSPNIPSKSKLQVVDIDFDESAEYCEMDYEAMDDDEKSSPTMTAENYFPDPKTLKRSSSHLRQSKTSLNSLPSAKPPPLPSRNEQGMPVRDSACVSDFAIYDRPKAASSRTLSIVRRVIDVKNYHCGALSDDNKPLSKEAHGILRSALFDRSAADCALMLTHEDCRLLRLLEPTDLHAGVDNGLVVLLLPHGAPVRADLLERVRCTQFTVVVSILSSDDVVVASKVLAAWIAIAKELLMELGNIFSFVNVMAGICSKEMDQVSAIWKRLEKDQPKSMDEFQSVLVPALQRLRQSGAMPPNATPCLLPYIQPMLIFMESTNSPYINAFDWKFADDDYGSSMDTLWQWLEMGREWSLVSTEIRAVAKRKYGEPRIDSINQFQTEFFMRYLFGASGATAESAKRYDMMGQLVALLAKRH